MTRQVAILIEFQIDDVDAFETIVTGVKVAIRDGIQPPPHGNVTAFFDAAAEHLIRASKEPTP